MILGLREVVVVPQHHRLPVRRFKVGCRPAFLEMREVLRAGQPALDQEAFQRVEPYVVVGRTVHFGHRAVVMRGTILRRGVPEARAEVFAPLGPAEVAKLGELHGQREDMRVPWLAEDALRSGG